MMLTGHVFQDAKRRAKASGVDLFVSKPCLPDDLYSHILALAGWPIRARRAAPAGFPPFGSERVRRESERCGDDALLDLPPTPAPAGRT